MVPKPPFTLESAKQKVKLAQALWNTRDPSRVVNGYTATSIWRNRDHFLRGHTEIKSFLTTKWARERSYRLRKELFSFHDNKIAVQFWYEYQDAQDKMRWKRCYGIEHWTFDTEGVMEKRMMSGNDVEIGEEGRWFGERVDDVDTVTIPSGHF
ncbi:MAG: hypothetical protein Q9167_004639 [Letrouitia subvulpina]